MIDSEILYEGRCFTIAGITVKGKCLAREFISGLEESERKKVVALLRRTADNGVPKNEEKFRHLDGKIYEFKSYQVRLLCFFEKGKFVILSHGFIKKQSATPRTEIERAQKFSEEFQRRRKVR